jgi:hypothetical protein
VPSAADALGALRRFEHFARRSQPRFERALHPRMHERSVLASEMDATLGRDGGRLQFAVLARQEQRERTARPRMMSQLQLAVWRTMPGVFSCGWMRARWRSTSAARSRCGMLARRRAGCPDTRKCIRWRELMD